ncbi:putative carboxylesterase [Rosa chinensis]|uniref:Putative carboxylesterase n=1 Tax=Rosa chinensis TaxID=74649 RepID=A0A2P6S558_ROSCH|nr:senescence-associated carboxylesterase 101 [Rosa chinensis]PRQ53806.1 putative carboxylesterase [Rosa chinensis]
MTIQNIFSSGLELANSLVNSDPLQQAWNAIENHPEQTSLYNVTKLPESNCTIISFKAPASMCSQIQGKQSLVNSSTDSTLKKFEFLCNKKNPSFSVNEAAVSLFSQQFDQLDLLKTQLVQISKTKPTKPTEPTPSIIVTGHCLGGCAAMLFSFWLLKSLDSSKSKRLLCITFGSPLLGDEQLRQCVSKFSTWNYCFLHVVSNKDPTPKLFQPPGPSGVYKPFGTFLLCSASGCACFEDPDFILGQLVAYDSQSPDYGQILEDFKLRAFCNNSFKFEGEIDPLQASIKTQLLAIGVLLPQQEPSMEIKKLIGEMKSKHERKVITQKKKVSDSDKKLNEMKMNMAKLEWYKKDSKQKNIGYYDMYKKQGNPSDINANEYKKKLMNYWEDSVAEVEDAPQMEGGHFRVRWLYGGTNYRRMIEPLHIAEYYKDSGTDYITGGKRPKQFILLEQWHMKKQEEDKKKEEKKKQEEEKKKQEQEQEQKPQASPSNKKREMVSAILTEDSCFWAHVEEAIILCNLLKNGGSTTDAEKVAYEGKLKEFEAYVWDTLKNYAVSSEIFLGESSFMRWWKEYKGVTADLSGTLLGQFMVARTYLKYGVEDLVFA